MSKDSQQVMVYTDGGSRGNPGPAAAGVVVSAYDGTVLSEEGICLGSTTNNVAEYRAMLAGFAAAKRLGADEVDLFCDSELLVRQMKGQYRVKNAGLKPLFAEAQDMAATFSRCTVHHIRRERNTRADELVNRALDLERNVGDAVSR